MSSTESEGFRKALARTSDAVLVVDEAGIILVANSHAEQLFGYAPGHLLGKTVETLVPDRLRGSHRSHRRQAPAEAHRAAMGERPGLIGLRADGSEFPADISLRPVKTPDGWMTVAVIRDLAEAPAIGPDHFVVPSPLDD